MASPPATSLAYLGFQLIPPGPLLRPFVRSYWYFRRATPLLALRDEYMHPRGGFGLVFNFGDRLHLDTQPLTDPVFLDGANSVSRRMGFLGQVQQMGVSFHEGGAYPFLGVPLAELRNQTGVLDAVERPALLRLYERLYEARTPDQRIRLLEGWLLKRLTLGSERDPLIPASLAALRRSEGTLPIVDLAQHFGISQRQLERLYHRDVGITPKQYAQLLRVETARLALKRLSRQSTTRLAVDLGFYDQAHFIREFRAVVGMTPYRYMKRGQERVSSPR